MFDPQTLILFAGACLVLAMIPGPDNLFVSAQSLAHGRKAGLAAASGILLGGLFWTLAATLGLTAIMAAMPMVLVAIQIAGAGYLLFLAFDLWRSADKKQQAPPDVAHAFVRGLSTNLLNPKVGLYYLAFLPQFVDAARGPLWAQMLVLGLIFNVIGGVVMYAVALIAGGVQRSMADKPGHSKTLSRVGALILLGVAGKVVWGLLH